MRLTIFLNLHLKCTKCNLMKHYLIYVNSFMINFTNCTEGFIFHTTRYYIYWLQNCYYQQMEGNLKLKEKEEGTCPVLLIYSTLSVVLKALSFSFTCALARFSSAILLVEASLFVNLSCANAFILSAFT